MSILAVIFGILSGCFLAVLVGIIGSHRRIGFGWAFLRRVPAAGADGRGHAAGPVKTGTEMSIPLHQAARRFDSGIFLKEGSSTEVEEPVGYAHRDDYGD